MKAAILAGGYGTRLSEETQDIPKPMVKIGGMPILWHIMKIYAHFDVTDFVVLLGYKGEVIRDFFTNCSLEGVSVASIKNNLVKLQVDDQQWYITLFDTGLDTMTGGRIKRAQTLLESEPFYLTYGDGVADIDINALTKFHHSHGKALTMTSVNPEPRFGKMDVAKDGRIKRFIEKPHDDSDWINGGFFVCNPSVFDYIADDDSMPFEKTPLMNLAEAEEAYTYRHPGFWKCMDTLRDKHALQEMWDEDKAKWKM